MGRQRFAVLAVMALCLLPIAAAMASSPAAAQQVTYPTAVLPGLTAPATIAATLSRPDGPGPFPAVIVLHDCSGVSRKDQDWAKRLVSWGYVAIQPDSFGSRKHGSLCADVNRVDAQQRVQDVVGTAEYLAALPYVQKDRIAVLGFSHGGWTIMKGVQENARWSSYGIKGAVAYYPYCTAPQDNDVAIPLRILIGEKDDWTPAQRCRDVIGGAKKPSLIEATFYPDTYHSFDCNCGTRWINGMGGGGTTSRRIEGNATATRDAELQTRVFLERLLR
ncbi:dienelactone hydrolase family protein [Reyranella massiliensis]|uniref:dienelactone hydrolase family protein n=1 Tax=Reyranella massiliensis TaxID=445220 RepID=UPI0006AD0943|nr:dienelactone hydrolase family protein [Reyranella massiliensis]